MKKINISSQLILMFFSIVLVTSCAFSLILLTRIHVFAEREVYSRLSSYVYLVDNEGNENLQDINVGYYLKNSDNPDGYYSPNLNKYISDENLSILIEEKISKENEQNQPSNLNQGFLINDDRSKIYYVYFNPINSNDYTIIFTDSSFATNMVRNVSGQVILIFFTLIIISIYIIFLWSNNFVKRIKLIQSHIINLPKDKYEVKYIDDSLDEIGELSRSIEQMRLEINHNEKTKQEMLQNLSHDFKTPIAVIKSYAEAQQDGMADEEATKIIISQAELLKKKVNRLLQYNSLEYLNKDREFEDVCMNDLINEIIQNYKFQTNLTLEVDLSENVYFKGYKENLYTVVDNIVDNAKRYAKTKIKIVLRKGRLRIYNDGEHIDEAFLKSGFKPYEKGSKGEFGLGLSIVKKTIDFFGLELKVVNETDGVSFIIKKINN